jgi:FixJ family two-component response regulator
VRPFKKHVSTNLVRIPVIGIVDDDESVRLAVHRLVCSAGMKAVDYSSGEDLIRDFGQRGELGLDCIVLDLHMLGMNGLQIAEWLTQRNVGIPLVFVSGGDEDAVEALGGPADLPWIRKPFDDEVLLPAIEAALKLNKIVHLSDSE